MKLAKWGNSLALRIPAEVAEKLRLSPGEEVELQITGENAFEVCRDRKRQEAIEKLRRMRFTIPGDYKFDREELNER